MSSWLSYWMASSQTRSMPVVALIPHKALFQGTLLEVADKVSVAPLTLLNSAASPRCSSIGTVEAAHALACRGIIGWAGLETDGLAGIKMAGHSLNSCWNTALLLFHCRCSLTILSHSTLLIHVWLRHRCILPGLHLLGCLSYNHGAVLPLLRTVGRLRHTSMASPRRIHVVLCIHLRLHMARRRILSRSHLSICTLRCSVGLCLRRLRSLLAQGLSLLLLLGSRRR